MSVPPDDGRQLHGGEKDLLEINFGSGTRRSVYSLGGVSNERVTQTLNVRGHANVSVAQGKGNTAWQGRDRMRLVIGSFTGQDSPRPLYPVTDEETEAVVADAVKLLNPEATLSGQWITKPE